MLRVLVVDDSPAMRLMLTGIIESDPGLRVVATAVTGEEAIRLTRELRPDVITMDLVMTDMDGYEATQRIMEETPTPVVVISAVVDPGERRQAVRALQAGALTVLPKPVAPENDGYEARREHLVTTLKLMADVKVVRRRPTVRRGPAEAGAGSGQPVELVAVGASTGGPQAISQLLKGLPAEIGVPVVVAQHIAPGFTEPLVEWLQVHSRMPVMVGQHGQELLGGRVYVAPDHRHLVVERRGRLAWSDAPPVHSMRPSVSVLFHSVADTYGPRAVGVLLTGMGSDGAGGLKAIREAGGIALVQDEASSAVYGMPAAAVALGAADQILPVSQIAPTLLRLVRGG